MKNIITVTLNPAIDIHYEMEGFAIGRENYVKNARWDVGGKGINISRALSSSGYENTAYAVLGRENCAEFEKELKRQNITYKALYVDGKIRENITLHPYMDKETRISLDSFEMSEGTLKALFDLIEKDTDGGTVVAFSGRLPRGISEETAAEQLLRLKEKGARLAIDCNSLSIDTLKRIRPWFIKPNEQEVEAFFGRPVQNAREAADFALELVRCGASEQVMISLGSNGCAFSDGEGVYTVSVPKIEVKSTIGAGDSTVAGYIAAISDGADIEEALALACAFGSAACLTCGTNPPTKEDIDKIKKKITVKRV